jgi:hypothetical protein
VFWSEHPAQPAGQARAVEYTGHSAEQVYVALALSGTVPAEQEEPTLIEAARGLAIPSLASHLKVTLRGETGGCEFHVRVQDAEKETFGFVFSELASERWAEMTIALDAGESDYHYGGDNNSRMTQPLRLQSVAVVNGGAAEAGAAFRVLVDGIACHLPDLAAIPVEVCELEQGSPEPPWRLEGRNLGGTRLEMAADEARPDLICTWLNFAWGGGNERSNSFAELLRETPLDAAAGTVFAWIKGDGSGNLCTFRFQDATGEVLQLHRFTTSTYWKGWRCVFLDTYLDRDLYWIDHWGGDNNGLIDPPLTFQSIVIDDIGPQEQSAEFPLSAARGRIGIGSVWFVPWDEG